MAVCGGRWAWVVHIDRDTHYEQRLYAKNPTALGRPLMRDSPAAASVADAAWSCGASGGAPTSAAGGTPRPGRPRARYRGRHVRSSRWTPPATPDRHRPPARDRRQGRSASNLADSDAPARASARATEILPPI